MQSRTTALSALALIAATIALPAAAVQRTFVASYGNDANTASNCSFANPCRGFTAAQTATDPGGEIVALDAAGYGAVTITKSITITANPGFYAGISVSSGDGVTIATAGVNVTLRGLNINGIGGGNGINMTNGSRLAVENCVISNFSTHGIFVNAAAKVRVFGSLVRDNASGGVFAQGGATVDVANSTFTGQGIFAINAEGSVAATTTSLNVADSVVMGNGFGIGSRATNGNTRATVTRTTISDTVTSALVSFNVSGTSVLTVSDSVVTMNSFGFVQSGGSATFESLGNNVVRQNTNPNQGTITIVSPN
jgi:hypothetical protein